MRPRTVAGHRFRREYRLCAVEIVAASYGRQASIFGRNTEPRLYSWLRSLLVFGVPRVEKVRLKRCPEPNVTWFRLQLHDPVVPGNVRAGERRRRRIKNPVMVDVMTGRWKLPIVRRCETMYGSGQIANVVHALRPPSGCSCTLNGGKNQRHQHRNNRDRYQEFDDREPRPIP